MDYVDDYDYSFASDKLDYYLKLTPDERERRKIEWEGRSRSGNQLHFTNMEAGAYYVAIEGRTGYTPWLIYVASKNVANNTVSYYHMTQSRASGKYLESSSITYPSSKAVGPVTMKPNGWSNFTIVEVIGQETTFMNWFHENPLSSRKGD